ncbi:FAD-dependent monooxygenase [Aeromonas veronii bv. sobria]|uniref:2-octaprenyl-3-methyl-6-methoxy-1,4-benzoquinol hydroxylase n=1 Tax=Aeromonas veronii TaxID=654 RepID=A0ABY3MHI0_AERVE|nr:FAD-dependent oxidoreductase [Aeromonas veronii]RDU87806.1 2-octaprenyl-3-methyl-6-methoxy-1,4-benzoquinol hydroxylase [Aeromonas veronii]RDU88229.1 2-octaprenyl-3-methyl-6-methoxy-1,4-benzoquinol hydroxylase [Aeromonas veronii]TEY54217.1 2-octaprenyl-3-methyl-6-methoxy-1,4-benzoquinol hydroxylase [Aeromonas veronii]TEY83791.1 2-octaprenyl-3-methyl-6-methoxy-1,4-benzoquinol hydroxylase [Aeromonas veronii]TYD41417.1 2-octaprenyl-3-methyl-6-methoxy-1,4-benzoquinol hydroxylase [Aeromonas veron
MEQCDIAIVGAGMVGAATACLLAAQGLSVRVIETQLPEHYAPEQPLDLRVSAISQASVALLEQAGAWHHLQQMRLCPYRRLETWELDGFATRFNSADLGLPQLGYIIENRLVQLALLKRMEDFPTIQTHTPAAVISLRQSADEAVLTLDDGTELAARWVLACDGAESHTRKLAGIGVSRFEYRQHCMLINIDTDFAQEDITWQQFTSSGPRAFLPLPGQHGSLVWYDSPARIRALAAMSNEGLAAEVRRHFPSRLGGFTVTGKGSFPLVRRHANDYHVGRVVLLGDAAHTINPLAGQGVNLGFKDVTCWADLLQGAGADWHQLALAERYERRRRPDNLLMQSGMDLFYGVFSNEIGPLKLARNLALNLADKAGPLKEMALRYALGLV